MAGLDVRTLSEVYGMPADETVADTDWLERAGRAGWAVLMKDERIRYRPAERDALRSHQVRAFCLSSGNLRAAGMPDLFLRFMPAIVLACAQPGPFLCVITRAGLRPAPL